MIPHLNPVGHQSTNWLVRLVLMVATAALTSFGTGSHIFSVARIALCHHTCGLERRVGDFSDRELLVVNFFCGNDWCIRSKHEMDSRIWHKVGLEFSDVNIQSTVKSERSGQRRNNLNRKINFFHSGKRPKKSLKATSAKNKKT